MENNYDNGLEVTKTNNVVVNDDDELSPPEIGVNSKPEVLSTVNKVEEKIEEKTEEVVLEPVEEYAHDDVVETSSLEKEIKKDNGPIETFGIYTNINPDFINAKETKFLNIPTIPYEGYYRYVNNMGQISEKTIANNFLHGVTSLTNMESINKMVSSALFKDFKFTDKPDIVREDVVVEPRYVNVIPKTKKSRVMSIVKEVVKGGKDVQMPLYNSGFQITFKVPETPELYNIRKELKDIGIEQEISTGGFLFNSTKGDIVNKILNFLFPYIVRTTLAVPKGEPIYKYIDAQDYPAIISTSIMSLYPNGNTTTITCKNSTVFKDDTITENGEKKTFKIPICDFVATATLSIKDTIKVREERITDFMFDVISRRKDGSVSIEDWKQYQKERMSFSKVDDFVVFKNGNNEVRFNFITSTLDRYIDINDMFSNSIKNQLSNIGMLDTEDREKTLKEIMELNKLTSYNSYVKEIVAGDDVINMLDNDPEVRKENLEILSDILLTFNIDELSMNTYLTKLFDFISYSTISGVAINNFTCPKCNEIQVGENELIWLDPLNHFLEMLDYKFMSIVED